MELDPQLTQNGSQFWNFMQCFSIQQVEYSPWVVGHLFTALTTRSPHHPLTSSSSELLLHQVCFVDIFTKAVNSMLGSQAPCDCAFLGSILLPPLHYYPKVWSRFPCPNPCLWPSLNLKSLFNIIINREKLFYLNFLQVISSLPVLSLFCWGLNFWNTNQKVSQLTSMPILTTHTSSWWRKRRPSHLQIWEKRKGKNKEKKIRYFGEFTGSPVVRTLC